MNSTLIERIDAKLNPIMIKEIHQGFRSRWFLMGYGLVLLISLGGYLVVVLPAPLQNENLGFDLFKVLMISMALIMLLLIPVNAGNQLRNEITSNTLDLIAITHLSPWAIVSGRFQAAMLKMLLLLACIGPFAISAWLLGGIGISSILYSLGFLLLLAISYCALFLMINALPALSPRYKILATVVQISFILLLAFFLDERLLIRVLKFSLSGGQWYLILITLLYIVLWALLVSVFFLRMAAELLTPSEIRTFLHAKLMLAVWVMLTCIAFCKGILLFQTDESLALLFIISLLMLSLFALFWSGQANKRTPHHWIVHYLFGEGYTPTLIYMTMLTLGIYGSLYLSLFDHKILWLGLFWLSYYTFFSGLARLLRSFLKPEIRTVLTYIICLLVLMSCNGLATLIYFKVNLDNPIPGVLLTFLPIAYIKSWQLAREVVGYWMLLPLIIGWFAAWLGREKNS